LTFCAYSNYLKYVKKAEPAEPWRATYFGQSIHAYIAGLYRGFASGLPTGERFDNFKNIPVEEYILNDVLLVEGQNPNLWSEEKRAGLLTASLANYNVVGVPDLVTQPRSGMLAVTDYKTGKMRLSPAELASDAQMVLYRWLLEENGHCAGTWLLSHCYVTQSGKGVKWVTVESTEKQYRSTLKLVLRQLDFVFKQEIENNHFPPVAGFDPQTCRICAYRDTCAFAGGKADGVNYSSILPR
jgi:hypothetical protein